MKGREASTVIVHPSNLSGHSSIVLHTVLSSSSTAAVAAMPNTSAETATVGGMDEGFSGHTRETEIQLLSSKISWAMMILGLYSSEYILLGLNPSSTLN